LREFVIEITTINYCNVCISKLIIQAQNPIIVHSMQYSQFHTFKNNNKRQDFENIDIYAGDTLNS